MTQEGAVKQEVRSDRVVPEDPARLVTLNHGGDSCNAADIAEILRHDQVALVTGVSPNEADDLVATVATRLGLQDELEVQAGFAAIQGHRKNVGKYFMSVNKRVEYAFVSSHSEGSRNSCIQLASFYCHENTTDGGVTILQHVQNESPAWRIQREVVPKVDLCGKVLSAAEIARAKMQLSVKIPDDQLTADDVILEERNCPFPGIRLLRVLAKPRMTYSRILDRELNVYWDNVGATDCDAAKEYLLLLRQCGLLREPMADSPMRLLDANYERRVWNSGVKYADLFEARVTRKLAFRELIIFNNLTWTHSASNWTPGSGTRNVVAAFA